MNTASDFAAIAPFRTVCGAGGQTLPFVFNSPHSGRIYPPRFLAMSRLDSHSIRRSEDCYVDELFSGVAALGIPFLQANFPRAYLDVNREPWELDQRMFVDPLPPQARTRTPRVMGGLGTVPRLVAEGMDIYPGRIATCEAISRVDLYYRPYHSVLADLIARTHARFGYAVLIDCHSMPQGRRRDDGPVKGDFILGDRFGLSAHIELTQLAVELLSRKGYSVALNHPYAGGFITQHYGRPSSGFHALQIEINRGLYMDEDTLERGPGFGRLAEDLQDFVKEFVQHFAYDDRAMPDAAE